MAEKTPDIYVRLDAKYDDDEAMWEISPYAELLFIRGLAYSKRKQTDGAIPQRALQRLCIRISADAPSLASELVTAGLWEFDDGDGWVIPGWSKWQMTTDEQDIVRERKQQGGYAKAHRDGRHDDAPNEKCALCITPPPGETCSSSAAADAEQVLVHANQNVTETETETQTTRTCSSSAAAVQQQDAVNEAMDGIAEQYPDLKRTKQLQAIIRKRLSDGHHWARCVTAVTHDPPPVVKNSTGYAIRRLTDLGAPP